MALTAADLAALSRLLDEVIDLEGAEREAWLAALPDADAHLAPMLRDMLAERDSTRGLGRLSSVPALAVKDEAVATAGELVGPYRLIREIGRGGMGAVWLAERADGSFKRQVALKLPRLAWGTGLAERMAREREIGALLEHPHIARLYDAGVDERGRPYLALEYIAGKHIDAWCQDKALSIRERLKLIVQVARAVSYAHGRLVVHRDLKPSNVLVTEDGQTHLLDFGIAKLLHEAGAGETGLTQDLGRVLTPHFASPEQMRGDAITVQSDVYSLGVLLYELLTGSTPYRPKRNTLGALEEAILEGEPALASSRASDKASAKAIRGEVDAILAKALRREPGERYATADALANDIERYLNGDTVLARPDSTWYRLRKSVQRHRFGVAATTAVLVAIVAGSGAALVQANRATKAAERERVVKEFVGDVFRMNTSGNPANAELRKLPVEMLLEHGASLIQTRFPGQPEIQAELYGVVGSVFADMSAYKLASDYLTRQIEALGALNADDNAKAQCLLALALVLLDDDRPSQAETHAHQAVELARNNVPLLAEVLVLLARAQHGQSLLEERNATMHRATELLAGPTSSPSLAKAWLTWLQGSAADDANRFDLSLLLKLQAIDIAQQVEGASSKTATEMKLSLGHSLIIHDRLEEALKQIEPALAVLENLGGAQAVQAAMWRAKLWEVMHEMQLIPSADALAMVRKQRALIEAQTIVIPEVVRAKIGVLEAGLLRSRGAVAEAESLMSSSIRVIRATQNPVSFYFFNTVATAGLIAMAAGRHDEADVLLREWLQVRIAQGDGDSAYAATNHLHLALNQTMQGRYAEAQAILDAAPSFAPLVGDPLGWAYEQVIPWERARLMLHRGDASGALVAMQHLADLDSDPVMYSVVALRAETLCAAGRPEEGLATMLREMKRRAEQADPNDPALARHRAVAGLCALSLGDRRQATQLAQASREAFTAQPGVSPWFKEPLVRLERSLSKQGSESHSTRSESPATGSKALSGLSESLRP